MTKLEYYVELFPIKYTKNKQKTWSGCLSLLARFSINQFFHLEVLIFQDIPRPISSSKKKGHFLTCSTNAYQTDSVQWIAASETASIEN